MYYSDDRLAVEMQESPGLFYETRPAFWGVYWLLRRSRLNLVGEGWLSRCGAFGGSEFSFTL